MGVYKLTHGGVTIAPFFGTDDPVTGTSTNAAGRLVVTSGRINGDFSNIGAAQTEFYSVSIIGRVVDDYGTPGEGSGAVDGTLISSAITFVPSSIRLTNFTGGFTSRLECDNPTNDPSIDRYEWTLSGSNYTRAAGSGTHGGFYVSRGLTGGIYMNTVSVAEDLDLKGSYVSQYSAAKARAGNCYGGARVSGGRVVVDEALTLTSTATQSSHLQVNGTLKLGGDLDMSGVASNMAVTSRGTSVHSAGDVCAKETGASTSGPQIEFIDRGGSDRRFIAGMTSGTIDMGAVGVKVSKGIDASISGGSVIGLSSVHLAGGELTTNGMLSINEGSVHIDQNAGAAGALLRGHRSGRLTTLIPTRCVR